MADTSDLSVLEIFNEKNPQQPKGVQPDSIKAVEGSYITDGKETYSIRPYSNKAYADNDTIGLLDTGVASDQRDYHYKPQSNSKLPYAYTAKELFGEDSPYDLTGPDREATRWQGNRSLEVAKSLNNRDRRGNRSFVDNTDYYGLWGADSNQALRYSKLKSSDNYDYNDIIRFSRPLPLKDQGSDFRPRAIPDVNAKKKFDFMQPKRKFSDISNPKNPHPNKVGLHEPSNEDVYVDYDTPSLLDNNKLNVGEDYPQGESLYVHPDNNHLAVDRVNPPILMPPKRPLDPSVPVSNSPKKPKFDIPRPVMHNPRPKKKPIVSPNPHIVPIIYNYVKIQPRKRKRRLRGINKYF